MQEKGSRMRLLQVMSILWLSLAATVVHADIIEEESVDVIDADIDMASLLPFSFPWMNHAQRGTAYNTANHKNGVFVIEAYFQACPACNVSAPFVNALAAEYANQPRVQVLDVGKDRRDADYTMWIDRHKPNHPVLQDSELKLLNKLGVTSYPTTVVINCRGDIAYSESEVWNENVKRKVKAKIDELLAAPGC